MTGPMLHRLKRDARGTATIELALLAPILATMIIGVVDLSNAYGRKLALEQATQRGIEKVMQTTADDTAEATIKSEVAAQAGIATANVTVTYQMECDQVPMPDYDTSACTGGQKEARYIIVLATDRYVPMFPLHFGSINGDGTYHLRATSGMRTK